MNSLALTRRCHQKWQPNKTFRQQIGKANFESISNILKSFSIEEVSKDFYDKFQPIFNQIAQNVSGQADTEDVNYVLTQLIAEGKKRQEKLRSN